MKHKMGLAKIILGTKKVFFKWMHFVNNDKTDYFVNTSGTKTTAKDYTIIASDNFAIHKPCLIDGGYYYLLEAETDYTINSSSTGRRKWVLPIEVNLNKGEYSSVIATPEWEEDWATVCYLYNYSGNMKVFNNPYRSSCYIQCWGGRGGTGFYDGKINQRYGGKGGYTEGDIILERDETLYIYVGGKGSDNGTSLAAGGWNGGGTGDWDHADNESSGAGGGATDIRLDPCSNSSTWNEVSSLCSRIMVAGGGGGGRSGASSSGSGGGHGGEGGNITGGYAYNDIVKTNAIPGSQNGGYKFGQGEDGTYPSYNYDKGGGGGGYYGGKAATAIPSGTSYYTYPGAGGSSFISGHSGCDAIKAKVTSLNSIQHSGNANHYSGAIFENSAMKSGTEKQPTPEGGEQTGNDGDGYAAITVTPVD